MLDNHDVKKSCCSPVVEGLLKITAYLCGIGVSVVSLCYYLGVFESYGDMSTFFGTIGWGTLLLWVCLLSLRFPRQAFLVFLLFFFFGFWRGPYLEPPADSLEHLRRIKTVSSPDGTIIDRDAGDEILLHYTTESPLNRGLWHYSMAAVIIKPAVPLTALSRLIRIHLCHGLFLGLTFSVLFAMARRNGFTDRWAFMGCLIALLFMGTNRISFFSYYSFAPSLTSLIIYWLWTGMFFFRSSMADIAKGMMFAILAVPVMLTNHLQEMAFLLFLVIIWLLLNVILFLVRSRGKIPTICSASVYLMIFLLLFVVPQVPAAREYISSVFFRNLWESNQKVLFYWQDLILMGKIWKYRIDSTYLYVAVPMILLSLAYFRPNVIREEFEKKIRVFILAFLPIIGYCVPLFLYVWVANVRIIEFYRLSYMSMFWLFFALFFQGLEPYLRDRFKIGSQ